MVRWRGTKRNLGKEELLAELPTKPSVANRRFETSNVGVPIGSGFELFKDPSWDEQRRSIRGVINKESPTSQIVWR